jgi:hypothetical protein
MLSTNIWRRITSNKILAIVSFATTLIGLSLLKASYKVGSLVVAEVESTNMNQVRLRFEAHGGPVLIRQEKGMPFYWITSESVNGPLSITNNVYHGEDYLFPLRPLECEIPFRADLKNQQFNVPYIPQTQMQGLYYRFYYSKWRERAPQTFVHLFRKIAASSAIAETTAVSTCRVGKDPH